MLALAIVAGCTRERAPRGADRDSVSPAVAASRPAIPETTGAKPSVVAHGTEPFWGVTVADSGIVYASPEVEGIVFPPAAPQTEGDETVYRSQRAGAEPRRIEVRLRARPCNNGMAERDFPVTAVVTLGDLRLTGCAETIRQPR